VQDAINFNTTVPGGATCISRSSLGSQFVR
jgi:hypothetical protein